MRVILIANTKPGPHEGGGARRTHQLAHELARFSGSDRVAVYPYHGGDDSARDLPSRVRRRLVDLGGFFVNACRNPRQFLTPDRYGVRFFSRAWLEGYRDLLATDRETVCVLENPSFWPLVEMNEERNVPTILAPWSFEPFSYNMFMISNGIAAARAKTDSWRDRMLVQSTFSNLAADMMKFARLRHAWFLSRVESGFAAALGLPASYLPYYPAGEALMRLDEIRQRRKAGGVVRGLFVISGGSNGQNRAALEKFLGEIEPEHLPTATQIVITGADPALRSRAAHLEGRVRFESHLSLPDFEKLLGRAHAMLIPQTCGFGCLTRVPDMLAAGVPVIVPGIALNAAGTLPEVDYVSAATGGWGGAMQRVMARSEVIPDGIFEAWRIEAEAVVNQQFENIFGRRRDVAGAGPGAKHQSTFA